MYAFMYVCMYVCIMYLCMCAFCVCMRIVVGPKKFVRIEKAWQLFSCYESLLLQSCKNYLSNKFSTKWKSNGKFLFFQFLGQCPQTSILTTDDICRRGEGSIVFVSPRCADLCASWQVWVNSGRHVTLAWGQMFSDLSWSQRASFDASRRGSTMVPLLFF